MAKRSLPRTKSRPVARRRRLIVEHLGERRVLASITGAVFDDANFSFRQDDGEANVPSRLIYIDSNANAKLDVGEQFVVAEPDGTFEFGDLADGTYHLRLFNGTDSQQQTAPVEATVVGETISISGSQFLLSDGPIVLGQSSLAFGNLESGQSQDVPIASALTKMQALPDGTLLVIGSDGNGETAWVVDPDDQSVTPVDAADEAVTWSDVAIDGEGRGLLVGETGSVATLFSVDATSPATGIQIEATATNLPIGAQVIAADNGPRSVIASTVGNGLELSLWSNAEATTITTEPVEVSGGLELLAYDDAAGLVALRTISGGVSVHDVNQDFATLHALPDVDGPVAIDGSRDLLVTVSPVDAMLRLIDIRNGGLIADLALDTSIIGQVSALAIGDRADAIVMLGAAGVTEVALNKASSKTVQVNGDQNIDSVLFGVSLADQNNAPDYESFPVLSTMEDTRLIEVAPTALNGAIDLENDEFVLIQESNAANGEAVLSLRGDVDYTPNDNFSGIDRVMVRLHDGRSLSDPIALPIQVIGTPDPPIDIDVSDDPIPENIRPRRPVADIEVIDVDLDHNHVITLNDGRFEVINGEIVFVRGHIDFEGEPFIILDIDIHDEEAGETIYRTATFRVQDENDPVTAITPNNGSIGENEFGGSIVTLTVEDQDAWQTHEFAVDDDRFFVEGNELKLKPDQSIDYELEQQVIVNVTANDGHGSSLTKPVTVFVLDIDENPHSLDLTDHAVVELTPGASAGHVIINDAPPNARFEITVDDPRFEVDGDQLKLLEDQFVERAEQEEIELTIAATDTDGELQSIEETFIITVFENAAPYHNDSNPYDVERSGDVTAVDALVIINFLNSFGPGPVGRAAPTHYYDVNADGMVTALDALLVLNEINRANNTGTVGSEQQQRSKYESTPSKPQSEIQAAPEEASSNDESETDPVVASNREELFSNWAGKSSTRSAGSALPSAAPLASDLQDDDDDNDGISPSVDETIDLLSSDQ